MAENLLSEGVVKQISDVNETLSEMCSELERALGVLSGKMTSFEHVVKQLNQTLKNNESTIQGVAVASDGLSDDMETMIKTFSSFKDIIAGGKFWENMSGGVSSLRDKLTGLQKGALTVTAAFAEFDVISEAFEGLVSGSEDVSEGIGKIAVASTAAGTAMYAALGPAGIAVAAIVGVCGAIQGINDAFDTIRIEEIGNAIKNALSNPGGVSLSEISAQFSDVVGEIGDGFSAITEESTELQQADSHIKNTWLEIEKIETAMDAGVLSVEEGTEKLVEQFEFLAKAASDKFSILEDTLLVAFGENGVLNSVFERLGITTDGFTTEIIQLNDKVEQRIEQLTELIFTVDPSSEEYAQYREELALLMAQTDELTIALENYELALSQIDYSDLIDPKDGSLNIEKLQNFLNEIVSATELADEDVAKAIEGVRTSLTDELNYALAIGDMESAEEVKAKLDALSDALTLLQGDIHLKATEITDTVQLDIIGGLNDIINQAQINWDNLSTIEQSRWVTEGDYIQDYLEQYKENVVVPISEEINNSLEEIGAESSVNADEIMDSIISSLFDIENVYRPAYHWWEDAAVLRDDWENILNTVKNGVMPTARDTGEEISDYTAMGMEEGMTSVSTASGDLADTALSGVRTLPESTNFIGAQITCGLAEGMWSGIGGAVATVNKIADSIQSTYQKRMNIHSPSRVMFELGDYTMQGLKEGLENLYQPILSSLERFGYDLQIFPVVKTESLFENFEYAYASAYTPLCNATQEFREDSSEYNAEINILLRELLSEIRKGHIIEMDGRIVAENTRKYANAYTRTQGKSYFEV